MVVVGWAVMEYGGYIVMEVGGGGAVTASELSGRRAYDVLEYPWAMGDIDNCLRAADLLGPLRTAATLHAHGACPHPAHAFLLTPAHTSTLTI